MMELIDRAALLMNSVWLCGGNIAESYANGYMDGLDAVEKAIRALPAVEAVPLESLCEWLARSALFNTGYRNKIGASMWKELIKQEVMEGWKDDNA